MEERMASRPISFIQIELTNHCNYNCRFCPQSQWNSPRHKDCPYNREKGFMAFDMFKRIIRQADKAARQINFSFFGEPMMHPEFLKFMDYLTDRNPKLKVVMNTNLSLATKNIFETLIEIKLDILRLSIDAASGSMYETIRPGNYCLDLDGNLKEDHRFELICQKSGYWFSIPGHRPTYHVFTVNSKNVNEMKSFADQWLPMLGNEDKIVFKTVLSYGGKIADDMLTPHPCNVWDLNALTVDWTGRVTPCNLDTNMDLTIGSISDSSLLKLAGSKKMQEIKRLSKEKKVIPCRNCIDANNWQRNIVLCKGDKLTGNALHSFLKNAKHLNA